MYTADKASVSEVVDVETDLCFTPISRRGTTKSTAISVEQYTEVRDIHQAVMASLSKSTNNLTSFIDLDYYDDDDEVRFLRFEPKNTPFGKRKKPFTGPSVTKTGQSSNSKTGPDFICEICVEPKSANESFSIQGCTHAYCTDCIVKYIASKLQENVTCIRCPVSNCKGFLEPYYCRPILPPEVFDRWGSALCEAVILGSQKFYCPYKDCSALLIDDGGVVIRESECPNCRRLFCAQCKVPWHSGIDCAEFQKLNKDERGREDIMVMKLAGERGWRRCPKCGFYVEKTHGCMYVKCRCGNAFCYNCGAISSTTSHVCPKCKH